MELRSLPTSTVLSDNVSICTLGNVNVIRVLHHKFSAAISLFGGHLLSFQPSGEKDILWRSENAIYSGEKPIRGGVPVCWPWFGKVQAPSHGFARNSEWALNEHRESEEGVIVSLTLKDSSDTLALWSNRFLAELRFEFSTSAKVSLIATNTDTKSWKMGGALHTYFSIGDIHQTKVSGLGNQYIDSLADSKLTPSNGTTDFTEEVDRIYTAPETMITIEDPAQQRRIRIQNQGDNAAVVWNPWIDLSHEMADMMDNGYESMVCVESTIHDQSVELAPGESHTLSTEIGLA